MAPVLTSRRLPIAVAIGLVALAFWPALFGGGSLLSADTVATAPPFDSYRPDGFSLENGPGDPINIHAHWASLAAAVRSGDAGWWTPDLAGGQPTNKGGLPIFDVPYLVTPAWFAPGVVAALRALVAIGLSVGFLRAVDLSRVAALAGGIAFGFSGFMVGWMNWPHSSVAALAPGLFWAVERLIRDPRPWRAIPLGLVAALMVWANFPSVLIYVLLGATFYAAIRAIGEWHGDQGLRWVARSAVVGLLGLVIGVLLAAPHLIGFSEYLDWADSSSRVGNPDDSSAGVAYLMTAVAPAVWGSDAVGAPWFGEGNWVEFNAHAGASVVVLAVLGTVSAIRGEDRRRRSVAVALTAVIGLGVLIAYVGGPLGVALGDLTGPQGGLMTRAKVLWSIGISFAAAFGVERLVGHEAGSLRRDLLWAGVVLVGATILLVPSMVDWVEVARATGALRATVASSTASMIALAATIVLVGARAARRISGPAVGWALIVVLGFELLSFAMPVPTIVDRDERLTATPAHAEVQALLAPGERLAGEGRTFFPSTTQLFDIDDARGQVLKSPGYQALLRAVDPDMLTRTGGGTPTYPNIAAETDPTSPVWDVLGVGVWAQYPDAVPYGTRAGPGPASGGANPAVQALSGRASVPVGGLRGVLIRVAPFVGGFIEIAVGTDDGTFVESRWIDRSQTGVIGVAVPGEHLATGSPVSVEVTAPRSSMSVSIDGAGQVPVGTVAGDDDLELTRVGDVLLFDRPVEPVRLVDAVEVVPDVDEAAGRIVVREDSRVAVVERGVALPATSDPDARLHVGAVRYATDRITVAAEADRDALLVVSQSWYPGWTAAVDGVETEIVVAEAAFIGVPIGAGSHEIELTFRPRHLRVSTVFILAGCIVVVLVLVDARRRGDLRSSRGSAG